VLVSAISPYRAGRERARAAAGAERFLEVFVDAPLEACRARDPKGLYRRVDAGLIQGFTGVDDPYEAPEAADLVLKTESLSPEAAAEQVLLTLRQRGWVG
jgi:adenylylsulfate kinase-like enzyme